MNFESDISKPSVMFLLPSFLTSFAAPHRSTARRKTEFTEASVISFASSMGFIVAGDCV